MSQALEGVELHDYPPGAPVTAAMETIGTARAMRHLRPDPVPEELIRALVWAGTRAASPNNNQLWRFIVVQDVAQKARIRESMTEMIAWIDSLDTPADESDAHIRAEARFLAAHVDQAPVLLFVCGVHTYPARGADPRFLWSVVNTASQNILVAARSLGLGATLTMMQVRNEERVREILGLPDEVWIGTMIPVGWPDRPFGPARRLPLDQVIHRDRWQEAL